MLGEVRPSGHGERSPVPPDEFRDSQDRRAGRGEELGREIARVLPVPGGKALGPRGVQPPPRGVTLAAIAPGSATLPQVAPAGNPPIDITVAPLELDLLIGPAPLEGATLGAVATILARP